MMCAGCAARVDKKLNSLRGVKEAAVNLASRSVLIVFEPDEITTEQIKKEVDALGYTMILDEEDSGEDAEAQLFRRLRFRTVTCWLLAAVLMCFSMDWIRLPPSGLKQVVLAVLSLVVLVWCGRGFFSGAWKQLKHGAANMDTLVALSTGIAFLSGNYDASVMITAFILTGRLLETRSRNSAASAIRGLMGLAPRTARVVSEEGEWVDMPINALRPGDRVRVQAGERIPVDGCVREGEGFVDESMISGEPLPVRRIAGDKVLAGTMVRQGSFCFQAEEVGGRTVLAHIIEMVKAAQGSKAPVQRIVDKVAAVFVPVVIGIAVLTFALWWICDGQEGFSHALQSAVAVLVIACPCALGLATPMALMVGIGRAAENNILIKDAAALENIRKTDALVIDKTGTLTIPNKDIDFTKAEDIPLAEREQLKPHAAEAVKELEAMGIELWMMSGDREDASRYWAEKAGIRHWKSKVLPKDKEDLVRKLQAEGRHVAMVGDGINDSQALAAADVSIAMGKGTDIAMDVAQMTLMSDDLRHIPAAVRLSGQILRAIKENLFWASIYNLVSIPLAAGLLEPFTGFQITPVWSAALMALSSVSVVLNSLRLKSKLLIFP